MKRLQPYLMGIAAMLGAPLLQAQSPYRSNEEFAKYAAKLRENAISQVQPRVNTPTMARTSGGIYRWRNDIITTTFWVGEGTTARNPVHNSSSSWDVNWSKNFGGYDNPDPKTRVDYRPAAFIPRQNPFYIALPYNDTTRGTTKPEAPKVIPWFKTAFERPGKSVCRDRWVAVRNRRNGKIAYAQWSDCGPFRTDHYQYVFGNELPKPNLNGGAGLDVSPSVRDYLGISGTDTTDWRFVEVREVPPGPWRKWGDNNPFVQSAQRINSSVVSAAGSRQKPTASNEPNVVTKIVR